LSNAGLQVVAVAMGQPKHAAHYCGKLAPSVACLSHETANPYFAYGLSQAGMKELMSFNVAKAGMDATREGFMPGQIIGDPRMMPGSFLVDKNGIVQWAYYGNDVSDHPSIVMILEQARRIA
jgi:hypothetical protein